MSSRFGKSARRHKSCRGVPDEIVSEMDRSAGAKCPKYRSIPGTNFDRSNLSIRSRWTLLRAEKYRKVCRSSFLGESQGSKDEDRIKSFFTKGNKFILCNFARGLSSARVGSRGRSSRVKVRWRCGAAARYHELHVAEKALRLKTSSPRSAMIISKRSCGRFVIRTRCFVVVKGSTPPLGTTLGWVALALVWNKTLCARVPIPTRR